MSAFEELYYSALETLLDEVDKRLKPKVRCVPQHRNIGASDRAPYKKYPHAMSVKWNGAIKSQEET